MISKQNLLFKALELALIIFAFSCSNHMDSKKHNQLISFESIYKMDMDSIFDKSEEEYQRLTDNTKFYTKTDTIEYYKDTIYISYLTYVNACAQYAGDIQIKNDSLILKANNILDVACSSGRLDRYN